MPRGLTRDPTEPSRIPLHSPAASPSRSPSPRLARRPSPRPARRPSRRRAAPAASALAPPVAPLAPARPSPLPPPRRSRLAPRSSRRGAPSSDVASPASAVAPPAAAPLPPRPSPLSLTRPRPSPIPPTPPVPDQLRRRRPLISSADAAGPHLLRSCHLAPPTPGPSRRPSLPPLCRLTPLRYSAEAPPRRPFAAHAAEVLVVWSDEESLSRNRISYGNAWINGKWKLRILQAMWSIQVEETMSEL